MMKEIVLDVSDLAAPEPFEKIFDAIFDLEEGEYLKVVHRMFPRMIMPILKERGFFHILIEKEMGIELYICLESDEPTKEQLGQRYYV